MREFRSWHDPMDNYGSPETWTGATVRCTVFICYGGGHWNRKDVTVKCTNPYRVTDGELLEKVQIVLTSEDLNNSPQHIKPIYFGLLVTHIENEKEWIAEMRKNDYPRS